MGINTNRQSYEGIEQDVYNLLEIPTSPEESKGLAFSFNPLYSDDLEQIIDMDGREYLAYKGNLLNIALGIFRERYSLEKPLWKTSPNELAGHDETSTGLANLSYLINGLTFFNMYQTNTRHAKSTRFNANRFYALLEDSIPHTVTVKRIWHNSIAKFGDLFESGYPEDDNQVYPVLCLFDVIYLSLRAHTIQKGQVCLRECVRCHRLFLDSDSRRYMCELDLPVTTCSNEDRLERSRLDSQHDQLLKEIKREIAKNSDIMDVDKNGDPRLFSEFKSDFDINVCKTYPRNSGKGVDERKRRIKYLTRFQELYDPDRDINELMEEARLAIESQKDL